MRVVSLAGGIGGARFLRGLQAAVPDAELTVVVNTGDDITMYGLRICPDLDTVMYTLGGGIDEQRGWGRQDETFHAREELQAYDVPTAWFGLGDRGAASQLAACLMGLVALLLLVEHLSRGGRRFHATTNRQPPLRPVPLRGWRAAAACAACSTGSSGCGRSPTCPCCASPCGAASTTPWTWRRRSCSARPEPPHPRTPRGCRTTVK